MLSALARSLQCSMTTCKALVIMFSISSVLPDDSRSLTLSRGKQKEKAGAESGAGSEEEKREITSKHLNLYLRHNQPYTVCLYPLFPRKRSEAWCGVLTAGFGLSLRDSVAVQQKYCAERSRVQVLLLPGLI